MVRALVVFLVSAALLACSRDPAPGSTYYERNIEPILTNNCERAVAPCHRADDDGNALGNLDVSSFETLSKRRDLLRRYGAYPESLLLIKAVGSAEMFVDYNGEFLPLEINHAGGPILTPGSDAYSTLKRWLDRGATENGLPPFDQGAAGRDPCSTDILSNLDPSTVMNSDPGFSEFAQLQPYFVDNCGAGDCHGSLRAAFHLTCGDSDDQTRANYLMSRAFVAGTVDDSPLLEKALDPSAGGDFHAGGVFLRTREGSDYQNIRQWAEIAGVLPASDRSAGREFFDNKVMPILLRRGCAEAACHSPIVPFQLNLLPGAQGFFSSLSLDTNYKQAKKFLGRSSRNPIASRIVAKNVIPSKGGIVHRAGPLLETPGHPDEPASCPTPYDADTASPLCTMAEWQRIERAAMPADRRADLITGSTLPIVYIERPADAVRIVDFAAYRPGADLIRAEATVSATAGIDSVSGGASLLDGCPGIGAGRDDVDVRGPEASYDGRRIVFSMRIGEADGHNLYEVGIDGSGCRKMTDDGGQVVNGIRIHNFDPFYYLNGDEEWIVYASSRGGQDGPVRSPKLFLPASDIWRQLTSGSTPERLTFQRGDELQPFLTNSGKMAFVVEKASPEFYQFASRRLNWDRSDYHPELGQRSSSFRGRNGYLPGQVPDDAVPIESFGYSQVSEIRNQINGNFLVVLTDTGTWGKGGALGIFNRSIGPFEMGRDDPGFVKSLTIVPGPTGRAGESTGAYRSPYGLPDGTILASYASGVDVGNSSSPQRYELVVVEPRGGSRRVLRTSSGSIVEATLALPRPSPKPFVRKANTKVEATAGLAVLNYLDLPLLATIQGANDRRGRNIESLRGTATVRYFTRESPPARCVTPMDCADQLLGSEQVYDGRLEIGSTAVYADGSVFTRVPTDMPIAFELLDKDGSVIYQMQEETQLGPYENINLAVPEHAYSTFCGVCHGAISGRDVDISVKVDVVTTASLSTARANGIRELE